MKNKIILFFIPFAGGTASSLAHWKELMIDDFIFVPLELPGKGKRFNEKYIDNYYDVVSDLYNKIKEYIEAYNLNYVILGHSMGGYITYDICRLMEKDQFKMPLFVIISASIAINKINSLRVLQEMQCDNVESNTFIEYIREMGGMPDVICDNKHLSMVLAANIKKDICLLKKIKIDQLEEIKKIKAVIFYASEDDIKINDIIEWNKYFLNIVEFKKFEGNHFFILGRGRDIVLYVLQLCNSMLEGQNKQAACFERE